MKLSVVGQGGEQRKMKISQFASGNSVSLKHLDDGKIFSIIGVEDSNYDDIKGVKITTLESFDIEGKAHSVFHTTRVAITSQLESGELRNMLSKDNPLKVKIGTQKNASGKPYFVLEDVE